MRRNWPLKLPDERNWTGPEITESCLKAPKWNKLSRFTKWANSEGALTTTSTWFAFSIIRPNIWKKITFYLYIYNVRLPFWGSEPLKLHWSWSKLNLRIWWGWAFLLSKMASLGSAQHWAWLLLSTYRSRKYAWRTTIFPESRQFPATTTEPKTLYNNENANIFGEMKQSFPI